MRNKKPMTHALGLSQVSARKSPGHRGRRQKLGLWWSPELGRGSSEDGETESPPFHCGVVEYSAQWRVGSWSGRGLQQSAEHPPSLLQILTSTLCKEMGPVQQAHKRIKRNNPYFHTGSVKIPIPTT